MAIKPILFNTEMVRSILAGRKTCTRRIMKPQPTAHYGAHCTKPPYQQGDILYVRETWCKGSWMNEKERYYYKADDNDFHCVWHPSIHMPKEAARIWLKVTDVRVERLHDITGKSVLREGINSHVHPDADYFDGNQREVFAELWDSTIKKSDIERYGWNANPWVWVIEFERCEKPKEVDLCD